MNKVPEAEARALLANALYAHDCDDWSVWRLQPGTHEVSVGLVDADGVGVRMQVVLRFHRGRKTDIAHYLFSVYKQEPHGLERVYQLDAKQWPKLVKTEHMKPHEHWGDKRIMGDRSWSVWTFEQLLAYFTEQTRIEFAPPPEHPEVLILK
ncbi:hypothetical protein [Variovorax sp. GT1P44]|uniref:hypothetical protein n=1 Tax=Variovorax sp. GT1P44 TaxID=3443742 RepID=UPI003F4687F9